MKEQPNGITYNGKLLSDLTKEELDKLKSIINNTYAYDEYIGERHQSSAIHTGVEEAAKDYAENNFRETVAIKSELESAFIAGAKWQSSGEAVERFKKPTDQQVVKSAILFNDGLIDKKQLSNMVALADFIIDRLYENGDMQIPSSKEK